LLLGHEGIVVDMVVLGDDGVRVVVVGAADERLTEAQRAQLIAPLDADYPNADIFGAWIAKELLRDVLACTATGMRCVIAVALHRFYFGCAATAVPEIHDLAETIETCQQPIVFAIATGLSNVRSEG
jgi:transposase